MNGNSPTLNMDLLEYDMPTLDRILAENYYLQDSLEAGEGKLDDLYDIGYYGPNFINKVSQLEQNVKYYSFSVQPEVQERRAEKHQEFNLQLAGTLATPFFFGDSLQLVLGGGQSGAENTGWIMLILTMCDCKEHCKDNSRVDARNLKHFSASLIFTFTEEPEDLTFNPCITKDYEFWKGVTTSPHCIRYFAYLPAHLQAAFTNFVEKAKKERVTSSSCGIRIFKTGEEFHTSSSSVRFLQRLMESGNDADCCILSSGDSPRSFNCHKFILHNRCPSMKDKLKTVGFTIIESQEDADTTFVFLKWIYCQKILNLSHKMTIGLLSLSFRFELMELTFRVCEFLWKRLANCNGKDDFLPWNVYTTLANLKGTEKVGCTMRLRFKVVGILKEQLAISRKQNPFGEPSFVMKSAFTGEDSIDSDVLHQFLYDLAWISKKKGGT